jgi:hypothetical protein
LKNTLKAYKMGHIKEPEGVDFVINGKPLTEKQKKSYQRIYTGRQGTFSKTKSS